MRVTKVTTMHGLRAWPWLLLACMPMATSAWAGSGFAYQTAHSFRWHSEGRYLRLVNVAGGGVSVEALRPATLWGLAQDELIVEADGQPVHDISEFIARVHAHDDTPMPLKVRSKSGEQVVMLAAEAHDLVFAPPRVAAQSAPSTGASLPAAPVQGGVPAGAPVASASTASPPMPAATTAHSRFAYQSDNTLRWHSGGQHIHLATAKEGGVRVVTVVPAMLWGLEQGMLIVEAGGQPVTDVASLVHQLRQQREWPMLLEVRQDGVEHPVTLDEDARRQLLPNAPAPASAKAGG